MKSYYDEVVDIWIKNFISEGKDPVNELMNIDGTISNERLWLKGSSTPDEEASHERNISQLLQYRDFVNELIKPEE